AWGPCACPGEHVGAVGGQSQLEQRAREARARLDEGEDGPRRRIETLERAPEIEADLADQPVAGVVDQHAIVRLDALGVTDGTEDPESDRGFIRTEVEDQVVELARDGQRPEADPRSVNAGDIAPRRRVPAVHGEL